MPNKIMGWMIGVALLVLLTGCSIEEKSTSHLQRLDSSTTPIMEEVYATDIQRQVYSTTEISPP